MHHSSVIGTVIEWAAIVFLFVYVAPYLMSALFGNMAGLEYSHDWTATQFDPYAAADAQLAGAINRVGRGW